MASRKRYERRYERRLEDSRPNCDEVNIPRREHITFNSAGDLMYNIQRRVATEGRSTVQPKPKHLGPEYAAQFQDAAIVAAYPTRPPYPQEVFELLAGLIAGEPRIALDVGCGTGDLTRRLAPLVERVDAVDVSERMIARGKTLPGGDASNIRWIAGAAEDARLEPPYTLITAGESFHWMDWRVVMSRLGDALAPGAYLALVERNDHSSPWSDALLRLIVQYTTNRDFQPYNVIAELEARSLFRTAGEHRTAAVPFEQSVEDYIESIHSRNGFSRDRMRPEDAAAFDASVRELVTPYAVGGVLSLGVAATVIWGIPTPAP
jgi:SAM-dependent methyltransferase